MFTQINFVEIFGAFIVMAAIIDIFGSIPIFMSMKEQNKTIKAGQACLTALGLFLAFFFAGDALLKLFGIDAASFAVAGAFVLFILAVEMILGREIIKNVLAVPETYAIVLKATGEPVGSIGLHLASDLAKEGEPELGYWIGVPFWGRGLVPEAATALLCHAFFDCGYKQVWCGYYEGNERSHRVQQKLGFVYQWTTDDVPVPQLNETRRGHVSLLTKENWEKQNRPLP